MKSVKLIKMKTILSTLFVASLLLSSCVKEHTCDCYNADGERESRETSKTHKQSKINEFENECITENNNRKASGGYCIYN